MIDSTNPRIMADNIRELESRLNALSATVEAINQVTPNPEGDATVQLTKIQIGSVVYGFEEITPAESTAKRSTSKK